MPTGSTLAPVEEVFHGDMESEVRCGADGGSGISGAPLRMGRGWLGWQGHADNRAEGEGEKHLF